MPRNRPRFGPVPKVAAPRRSSKDLRLPSSNCVLHPFSPEPPHETTNPRPLLARCSCPQTRLSASNFRSKACSHHVQLLPNQTCLPSCFAPRLLPGAILITPTPLHLHKHLPTGRLASDRCIGRAPHNVAYLPASVIGRIRYSTSSLSGQRDEALRHGRIDLRKSGVSRRGLLFADYSPGIVVRWPTQR